MTKEKLRLCLLHASFAPADVRHNVEFLEKLLVTCLKKKPDLIITPELAVSGYEFRKVIGTDWIDKGVPAIIDKFCRWAAKNKTALLLGSPSYCAQTKQHYNSAFFIGEGGEVLGVRHKVNVLPGSEGWSSPGQDIKPIDWRGFKIGLLICADAYTPNIAGLLEQQGAAVLLSPAAWAPGMHGPNGEWEQRSKETGLNLFVCNRTGAEQNLNFCGSSSVVVIKGTRAMSYADEQSAILTIEVDPNNWFPLNGQFEVIKVTDPEKA
ncbi:MAG: carbon-nitrogen hydrolase family protein [Chloroflexota bacterium]